MVGRKPKRIEGLLVSAICAALMGCQGSDRAADRVAVERAHRGDTMFVHSYAPVRADTARLHAIAEIGSAAGPDEQLLYDVSAFAELADGRVVVAGASGLRMYSRTGEFLETIARLGEGPGEVEYVVGLSVAADNALLAVDLGNRRINVYDLETGEPDHWPLPPGMPGNGRNSIIATDLGTVYVAYNPPLPADGSPMPYPRPAFVSVGGDEEVVDTLYVDVRFAEACPTRSSREWRSGFYEDLRAPYFPKVKWALSRHGVLAAGCPATYALDLLQPDGSVVRISREWEPVRVSADERESFVEGQVFSLNRSGYFGGNWEWNGPRPPGEKPAYQRIVFDTEGRVWLWPAQPSVRQQVPEDVQEAGAPRFVYHVGTRGAFDVFAASGEYLGAVRLPDDVSFQPFPGRADPFIRGDTVWAVRYDSLDVAYLTKYAVEWPDAEATDANGT